MQCPLGRGMMGRGVLVAPISTTVSWSSSRRHPQQQQQPLPQQVQIQVRVFSSSTGVGQHTVTTHENWRDEERETTEHVKHEKDTQRKDGVGNDVRYNLVSREAHSGEQMVWYGQTSLEMKSGETAPYREKQLLERVYYNEDNQRFTDGGENASGHR